MTPLCATIGRMARVGTAFKGVLVLAIALHIHHKVKGPAIDYVGLAAASGASFFGLPGPGESVLIAAAVFAARHKLDIASVVIVAIEVATAGGVLGWAIWLKAGRAVLTRPGPLHHGRRIRRCGRPCERRRRPAP